MRLLRLLSTALGAAMLCSAAYSATVTLDISEMEDLSGGQAPWQVREEGFVYTLDQTYLAGDHIYFHDDGGTVSTAITPENQDRFDLISADFSGLSRLYRVNRFGEISDHTLKYENTVVQGYRDGQVVAEETFRSAMPSKNKTFSDAFVDLDYLVVSYIIPDESVLDFSGLLSFGGTTPLERGLYCDEYCGSVIADNFVLEIADYVPSTQARGLSTIPLPASLVLLLAGLGSLIFIGRRRT